MLISACPGSVWQYPKAGNTVFLQNACIPFTHSEAPFITQSEARLILVTETLAWSTRISNKLSGCIVMPSVAKGLNYWIKRKILISTNISLSVGLAVSEFQNNFRNNPKIWIQCLKNGGVRRNVNCSRAYTLFKWFHNHQSTN
jgi:hypothetical protein